MWLFCVPKSSIAIIVIAILLFAETNSIASLKLQSFNNTSSGLAANGAAILISALGAGTTLYLSIMLTDIVGILLRFRVMKNVDTVDEAKEPMESKPYGKFERIFICVNVISSVIDTEKASKYDETKSIFGDTTMNIREIPVKC
ncbi:hypothetical protein DINM_006092 [Dirofilaria immitis]|nr:hypothetical protein [Dirofilaria immitis]